MSSILTKQIITNSEAAVDTYVTTVRGLNDELEGILNGLMPTNFSGDAATGFKEFYTLKVLPAITTNLTEAQGSLPASLKSMLESIQTQLLDTVDPDLGENNKNPGADSGVGEGVGSAASVAAGIGSSVGAEAAL